jgi:hypothetical protein
MDRKSRCRKRAVTAIEKSLQTTQPSGALPHRGVCGSLRKRFEFTFTTDLYYLFAQNIVQLRNDPKRRPMKDEALVQNSLKSVTERLLSIATVEERLHGLDPEEILRRFKPEERLHGLEPEEILRRFKPEERLAGLSPEHALLALPDSMLVQLPESMIASLPEDLQRTIRARIAR